MLDTQSVAILYLLWFVGAFLLAWVMVKMNS